MLGVWLLFLYTTGVAIGILVKIESIETRIRDLKNVK